MTGLVISRTAALKPSGNNNHRYWAASCVTPPRPGILFPRRRVGATAFAAAKREPPPTTTKNTTQQSSEMAELLRSLEGWAEADILPLLKPVDISWQPSDLLPDPTSPGFHGEVEELRAWAREVPDDYLVCLVGNMVTEEALPTYHAALNSFTGYDCPSCTSAWARWSRGWTAEENRHGDDVLSRYLYLCGRVDLRRIEQTIHHLISSGMSLASDKCPYRGFIYTAFQERATFIAHGNTARRAKEVGDTTLSRICGTIAADEKRHEAAYARVVGKLFQLTPDTAVRALEYMMRRRILMPASHMFDGKDPQLFLHYSAVAQRKNGVYTTADYADIIEFFLNRWSVAELSAGLTDHGRRAQDYVCSMPRRVRKMEEVVASRNAARQQLEPRRVSFSWVFNRQVDMM